MAGSIPIHPITRDAMALVKRKLAPHGVVVMHVSNRYLELSSVVAGIAAANGLRSWESHGENGGARQLTAGYLWPRERWKSGQCPLT